MYVESAISNSATVALPNGCIPPPTLENLFSRQPVESIEAGSAVFWEGDAAKHVFAVVEGVLRVYKILADGRRVITGFMYPGDLVGVSLKDHYLYTAEAVSKVKLRRFAHNRFQGEIDEMPELRLQLFSRLCDEMAAAQDQMVLLARKCATERVCSFLLIIAARLVSPDKGFPVVELPMTRLDMADYLGLTIETVSRTMTKLMRSGVISPSGRHAILIRQVKKMRILAGQHDEDDNAPAEPAAKRAVWPH